MRARRVGLAGLRGWRSSAANAVASPVAQRTSLSKNQVRAGIGAVFLILSLLYVAGVVKDLVAADE